MPLQYGLIGYPLTHSFSPAYFKQKFATGLIDALYETFPLAGIEQFPLLLQAHPYLAGLNVTIPYKETVIPYLDEVDDIVSKIGAVNCIVFRDGQMKGHNTDAIAFKKSLIPLLQPQHTHALILGSGGASSAVAYALKQLDITFRKVSRNEKADGLTYKDITSEIIDQYKLIINTTPLGMYPHTHHAPPVPYKQLSAHHLLYDLIYNPEQTQFLALGKANGAAVKNGLEMLRLQADASWELWNK